MLELGCNGKEGEIQDKMEKVDKREVGKNEGRKEERMRGNGMEGYNKPCEDKEEQRR